MTTLMVDLSSNNGTPNLRAHYAAGYRILALKATENTNYVWSRHAALADEWHRLGGSVWHYHFARPGSASAQAKVFVATVKPHLKRGDRIVLDAEVPGVNGAFATAFINTCDALLPGTPGAVYGSPYFLRDNGIRPSHGWGLWLADYAAQVAFIPPGWKTWLAWQYTDRAGHVAGIPGDVDESRVALPPAPAIKRVFSRSYPTLHPGARGKAVAHLQSLLNAKTHARLRVDGIDGRETVAAVNRVKATHRWKTDGVADRNVWNYLTH